MAEDRRVQRTKHALRQALLSLMADRGYDATTTRDIVDLANVGRSTFYAHYADKEDLLRENMAALAVHLRERMSVAPVATHPALGFSLPMLEHVGAVRPMFVALLGSRSSVVVHALFREMLRELVREGLHSHPDDEAVPASALEAYLVDGFLAVARWWVLEAPTRSVREVHEIYLRLASRTADVGAGPA